MENTEIEIIEVEVTEDVEILESEIMTEIETAESENTNVVEVPVVESIDYTETLALIQQNTDYLPMIANDVRVILVIVLLSFCWSCMRSWRVHVMGGK